MSAEKVKSLLNKLEQLTMDTLTQLNNMTEEQFEEFATHRENLTQELESNRSYITQEDRDQISTILASDPLILQRMSFLKNEAGQWLERKGMVRSQQNAYQNVYAMDSIFVDHRN